MKPGILTLAASAAALTIALPMIGQNAAQQGRGGRAPLPPMKALHPLDESYLNWPVAPADQKYTAIDGNHLKQYVEDQTAISRRYRDAGHQFWGRIAGTEADAENAQWMLDKFNKAGLSDVHLQTFDLPPQWMPQSWKVTATSGGETLDLDTAQPPFRSVGTPPEGLDLEAVDVGFASTGDLANRDLRGKAVFFYSTDFFSRHATINNGAFKRLQDLGASAIFCTLMIPGNMKTQFYPVNTTVPSFVISYKEGLAMRDMIGKSRGGPAPHVKVAMDVKTVPGLKSATVWGTLPGMTDETIMIVAHRDGWFEGANDNGSGVATMVGLAEYFAKVPKEQRRRTILFLGTTGHHDGTAESGAWLAQHKELFAKNALLINCEHTAVNELVQGNQVITKSNWAATEDWYVGQNKHIQDIAVNALASFGVPTDEIPARTPAGEIGRIYQLSPSIQVISTGLYWHSSYETADIIPPTALANITRAFAKIIDGVNKVDLAELQKHDN